MTPKQKIDSIRDQLRKWFAGNTEPLTCPYCQCKTEFGSRICCSPLAEVLDTAVTEIELEAVKAALDKASRN